MTIDRTELITTIRRLQREGQYDRYATPEADLEADRIGSMLASLDLTDPDVDRLWDGLEPHELELDHEQLAARAVDRARANDVAAEESDLVQSAGAEELRQRFSDETE